MEAAAQGGRGVSPCAHVPVSLAPGDPAINPGVGLMISRGPFQP